MTDSERIAHLEAELEREREEKARLLAIVEALTAPKHRSSGAERQARYRARHAKTVTPSVTSDVTVTHNTPPTPPLDGSPLPPTPSLPSPLSSPHPLFLSAPPEASPQTATETLALAIGKLPAPKEDLQPRPEDLQALWNAEAHVTLPRWQGMSDKRRRAAAARLRERPLQVWRDVILRLSLSPFCRGEEGGGWRASPDWILQPDVADKVLEGKYDRPASVNPDRPRLGPPAAPPRVSGDRPRI